MVIGSMVSDMNQWHSHNVYSKSMFLIAYVYIGIKNDGAMVLYRIPWI